MDLAERTDEQRRRRFESWLIANPETPLPPAARADAELALTRATDKLSPASDGEMMAMLTPCLAQCAATGMNQDDRAEWFHASMLTLERVPYHLLKLGCEKARRVCEHPSKIIPTILAEIQGEWDRLKRDAREIRAKLRGGDSLTAPPPTIAPEDRLKDGEAREILARFGIISDKGNRPNRDYSQMRQPTVEDYVELGVERSAAEQAVAAR